MSVVETKPSTLRNKVSPSPNVSMRKQTRASNLVSDPSMLKLDAEINPTMFINESSNFGKRSQSVAPHIVD